MQICHANGTAAPTDVQEMPGSLRNISNAKIEDFIADGWLIYEPSDTPSNLIASSAWAVVGNRYEQTVVPYTAEELAEQEAQRQAEAAAADLLANGERYVAEDEYILLCDMLGQCPGAHVKLGLGALQTLMVGMLSTAPARENALFQYLMGLQVALQRLGGVNWWDSCAWHNQAAIVNAAQERHNAIVGVLP
jgi:hypothetical protein